MAGKSGSALISWRENRGRNGWDIPSRLLPGQVAEALDVSLERGTLGRKRYGSDAIALSGSAFDGIYQLFRHVPGQNDAAAEVFADAINTANTAALILRVAAGTAAASLTLVDAIVPANHVETMFVSGNGKCFVFCSTGVNRGHVFDPLTSTTEVRRMGLPLPAAGTVANQGGGTYPAVLRYYRIQWVRQVSGATYLLSNLGTAVSFTPSGAGLSARITRPSGEAGTTHWIVWASSDGITYYQLSAQIAVGTATYDDTTETTDYSAGELAPEEGAYTPFPSCKFGLWTGDRLLGFGVWETAAGDSHVPKAGTVYFSPVLDTTSVNYADDERCSNSLTFKGTITVSRNSGAEDRAIAGPLYDEVFVFQSRGIYALTPTGQSQKPYLRSVISPSVGAVSQTSTFMGEDEFGRPCIYFLDPSRGAYRYGASGLQWLGFDMQDVWATFNPSASVRVATGAYDPERRIVIWEIATGSSNYPSSRMIFSVRDGVSTPEGVRYGWTRETIVGLPTCLAMLPTTIAATMSRTVSPYSGRPFGASEWLIKHNISSAADDNGTAYQGYVTSPVFDGKAPQYTKSISHAHGFLIAKATSGVEVQVSIAQNYGDRPTVPHQVSLTPSGVQTRVTRRIDSLEAQDISTLQVTIGDRAAIAVTQWTIDEFGMELELTDQMIGTP